VSAAEAQLLLVRALLLALLYAFLAAVGLVAWRELRAAQRRERSAPRAPGTRLVVIDGAASDRPAGSAVPAHAVTAIGRDLDNDLVLADPTISGRHAVLSRRDAAWWLEDLGSTNGTFVNAARLERTAPAVVRSGDVVQLGAVRLRLVADE
jgi:pSer/pThr/pTyr-binding forkhead associated (FHA) protein